jgi:hypothetical protein
MNIVETTCDWNAWLMNELLELLPAPAERDIPAHRFEQRRSTLVAAVGADVGAAGRRPARFSRLRALRVWLMSLVLILVLASMAASLSSVTRLPGPSSGTLVETAVLAGTPIAVSIAGSHRQRFGGTARLTQLQATARPGLMTLQALVAPPGR